MITDKVRNRINNLIDGQIRALEKKKEDRESNKNFSCACCYAGEVDEDIESLNKLKEHIKEFND